MNGSNLFNELETRRSQLLRRGFSSMPSTEELTLYLFDLEERIDAICAALDVECHKDARGRWRVLRR